MLSMHPCGPAALPERRPGFVWADLTLGSGQRGTGPGGTGQEKGCGGRGRGGGEGAMQGLRSSDFSPGTFAPEPPAPLSPPYLLSPS